MMCCCHRRFEDEQGVGFRRTPVIAVTANALPADRLRFSSAGMDGLVRKESAKA